MLLWYCWLWCSAVEQEGHAFRSGKVRACLVALGFFRENHMSVQGELLPVVCCDGCLARTLALLWRFSQALLSKSLSVVDA